MTLQALLQSAGVAPSRVQGDAEVRSMSIDSRRIEDGAVFVAMPGMTRESESFLASAATAGARSAIVHSDDGFKRASELGLAVALISNFEDSLWRVCDAFYVHPTRPMQVFGVTGTNGKTTVAWLLRDWLTALGKQAGYLGTLGFSLPDEFIGLNNTTPFAVELYGLLGKAKEAQVNALAIEVSSHALAQRRIDGVEFDVAVFTNLTQDHLDFHGSMGQYELAKKRLFQEFPRQTTKPFSAAINVGDSVGRRWAEEMVGLHPLRFAVAESTGVDLWAEAVVVSLTQVELHLHFRGDRRHLVAPLGGSYNVENLISAVAALLCAGYSLEQICQHGSSLRPVPGRFEPVPNDHGVGVIVDYAHSPDALEKLLAAVRPLTTGRVITVFGCGGDRDKTKRPLMGKAAAEASDIIVLTSDNPRTEEPERILQDIASGIPSGTCRYEIEDRPEAIAKAISLAHPGDSVVIAGKGHEDYQIIGTEKRHMDDRELAAEALSAR